MLYDFFKEKIVKDVEVSEEGITLIFDDNEWFECLTSFSLSISRYNIQLLKGKKIIDVYYVIYQKLVFIFDNVQISFDLTPALWNGPEDVVYKNYKNPQKLIVSVIE